MLFLHNVLLPMQTFHIFITFSVIDLKISENEAIGILRVASQRKGSERSNGTSSIVNGILLTLFYENLIGCLSAVM